MPWIQTFFFLQFESLQSCDFNAATPHQHLALELRQVSSNLQDMADSVCLPENVISVSSEDDMDMEVNDEQAVQSSAVSASQLVFDSLGSVRRKVEKRRRANRGSKGSKRSVFDYTGGRGHQRDETKRSKTQS